MASQAEENVGRTLRAILADLPVGADIPRLDEFQYCLGALEFFLPTVLAEIHSEWNDESLDGILPVVARKTGEGEAEIYGQCILITDQTLTPIHLHLQIDPLRDEVSWLELRLGSMGESGTIGRPYKLRWTADVPGLPDKIQWAYQVTFGKKRK